MEPTNELCDFCGYQFYEDKGIYGGMISRGGDPTVLLSSGESKFSVFDVISPLRKIDYFYLCHRCFRAYLTGYKGREAAEMYGKDKG